MSGMSSLPAQGGLPFLSSESWTPVACTTSTSELDDTRLQTTNDACCWKGLAEGLAADACQLAKHVAELITFPEALLFIRQVSAEASIGLRIGCQPPAPVSLYTAWIIQVILAKLQITN